MFNSLRLHQKNFESRTSLYKDLFYFLSNGLSLLFLACSNLLITLYLARYFNTKIVGQFNLLISFFIILGQISALGIHLSCLYHLNIKKDKLDRLASIHSALVIVFCFGLILAITLFMFSGFLEQLFSAPGLSLGLKFLAPAIIFYGINKVFLSILNISNRLHALAFGQGLRPLFWIASIILFFSNQKDTYAFFAQDLLFSELALFFVLVVLMKDDLKFNFIKLSNTNSIKDHLQFGIKAFPSHFLTDLNTRIDVLILAYFFPNLVGNYSFIALLIEGLLQIGILLRTILTPRFSKALIEKNQLELQSIKKFYGRASIILTSVAALFLYELYLPSIHFFHLDISLNACHQALGIMLIGAIVSSAAAPFNMALLLYGKPLQHSLFILSLCLINFILNILFIPLWGILGAAVAISVMLIALPLCLSFLSKKHIGVHL
jgi:O-antigen/teichoic acid export membrane protein